MFRILAALALLAAAPAAWGGLHYSGEQFAELPSQWRGYLLDQRALRTLGRPPQPNQPVSALREQYVAERDRLKMLSRERPLTADESADLGALDIRLGQADAAVSLLREALRRFPEHFRVAANLGTACQLTNELDQAAAALEVAVRLAPPKFRKTEELHLKLVRGRRGETKGAATIDKLFDDFDKLPGDAVSLVQTLGLWLPADGRLLWQLGEVARATGEVSTAAAILDGCVNEFGMDDRLLRQHRQQYRQEADKAAKAAPADKSGLTAAHQGHQLSGGTRFRSLRPLVRKPESLRLPPILPAGLNTLPWAVLGETTLDKPFRPTFADHLRPLDGKRVVINGYMQPTGDGIDQSAVLLIEFPVGCWFCEVPEPTGIILVEPPDGKAIRLSRDLVRIEGRLKLNTNDPEDFLYTIREAKVVPPE